MQITSKNIEKKSKVWRFSIQTPLKNREKSIPTQNTNPKKNTKEQEPKQETPKPEPRIIEQRKKIHRGSPRLMRQNTP